MPVELQVIRASEFVRLNADEELDFDASRQVLQMLAQACWKRGIKNALVDVRAYPIPAKPLFTPSQLGGLVRAFREAGFGPAQRLAILYRSDPHRDARTFAFLGRMRGLQVQAFESFESAIGWLSAASGREDESVQSANQIPIVKSRGQAKKPVREPHHHEARHGLS